MTHVTSEGHTNGGTRGADGSVRAVFDNRVTTLLRVDVPILSAPMGYVAKPDLVAAVSEAGAMGLLPGSLGPEVAREEARRIRDLTDKPFGINIPIAFMSDPRIVDVLVDADIEFVTTSAGSPDRFTPLLKEAGRVVFHVVPTLTAARRAVDAGVDGLVVEGAEGAGFKNPRDVSTMVLLPLVVEALGVPVIAAGGIADGVSMAGAFALGAEGVQMGTRMLASAEANVHVNMKDAAVAAQETDTMLINRHRGRPVRVLRTAKTNAMEFDTEADAMSELGTILELYADGDLEASLPQLGQVVGRIDEILPAREIIERTVAQFADAAAGLARYLRHDAAGPPR